MEYRAVNYINIKVPMRDGINLIADCYLPNAEGCFPVILCRSPYNATTNRDNGALSWTSRGFAYVGMDCRGRFKSEGECTPSVNEINDGYDTLEWISKQPWCNGNIGMVGGSYVAITQLAAAASGHPALKAISPSAISENMYDVYYVNGALELSFEPGWHIGCMCSRGREPKKPVNWVENCSQMPLIDVDERASLPCPSWREIVANKTPDKPYWQKLALRNYADKIQSAFFIQTSYFDLLGREGISIYTRLMKDPRTSDTFKKHSFIRIGPWGHGVNMKEGEYTFGDSSIVTADLEDDFLQSMLTGGTPATDKEPGPICYFTMGENKWHYTSDWPLPNTKYTCFYLGSDGSANTSDGNGFLTRTPLQADLPADHFTYDPANPVPSCGGRMVGAGGQKNQSEIEKRQDVLVYTSPRLTEDLTVTGNIRMKLYVSSSAPDTDFTVKLVDVFPDGRPMSICDGIQRVRYRNGSTEPLFLHPGEVAEIDMPVDFTSYQFKKGHAVRIEISSSNFPHYERNFNTGRDNALETEMNKAEQTIHHTPVYSSCLILPVIEN